MVPLVQIVRLVPKLNTGVTVGVTVTENVADVAQNSAPGVNVYVPEFWVSITDGLQVPEIPLSDVTGKDGTVDPEHIVSDVPKLNVGVTIGFTVTVKIAWVAHCPAVGVKV